jgi:NhaP-type Na+/H+ or K+/H+ antiporter
VRHSLNLESGLNDGLALPAVLVLAAALSPHTHGFEWWRLVLEDLGFGFVVGAAMGSVAARLIPSPEQDRGLFALGAAFATYGVAVLTPNGNGLIAVFVAAIVLGIQRPDLRVAFERQATVIVEVVKLGIFVVFGSLLTLHGLLGSGWAAVAVVVVTLLIARPAAVFIALAGPPLDVATKAFMAWFGPKGVATMTFSILVLSERIAHGTQVFNLAALTVFVSIIAHGVTDTPGSEWLARRAEQPDPPPDVSDDRRGRRGATDP